MIPYIIVFLVSFVLGLVCGFGVTPPDRMSLEEYMLAVQIIMNDMDISREAMAAALMELQQYAGDDEVFYDDLSRYVREVLDQVTPNNR